MKVLKAKSLENLKAIFKKDYGYDLSNEEANQFGFSLLKLSRLVMTALSRAEEKHLAIKI